MTPETTLRGGDDANGFAIEVEVAAHLMRVRLYGFWSVETGKQFSERGTRLGAKLAGSPWVVLADSREFSAQTPEVAALRQAAMGKIVALGCVRIAAVVKSATYAHQFKRITSASGVESAVFEEATEAMAWLKEALP